MDIFKLGVIALFAVILIRMGVHILREKRVRLRLGGRTAAHALTLPLDQAHASLYGLSNITIGAGLLAAALAAAASGHSEWVSYLFNIAIGIVLVTVVVGFMFACVIQLATFIGRKLGQWGAARQKVR